LKKKIKKLKKKKKKKKKEKERELYLSLMIFHHCFKKYIQILKSVSLGYQSFNFFSFNFQLEFSFKSCQNSQNTNFLGKKRKEKIIDMI
jgi:hypothetical protein